MKTMNDDKIQQEIKLFSLFSCSLFMAVLCLSIKSPTPRLELVKLLLGFTLLVSSFFLFIFAAYYWYCRATAS